MKDLKKIFDSGGAPLGGAPVGEAPLQVMQEAIVISGLYGRYLALKQIQRLAAESFAEFIIPSAYDEAIKFFLDKLAMAKEEFEKLNTEAKKKAFTVGEIEQERLISHVKKSLDDSLAGGLNIEEWKETIDQVFDQFGITELNPSYLDLVFRNATQEALNEGRFQIYEQADEDEFPLREFHTVEDNRVRPEHAKLNGFRAPKNDPVWQTLRPPLDHQCRCSVSLVHKSEKLKASKLKPQLSGEGFAFIH